MKRKYFILFILIIIVFSGCNKSVSGTYYCSWNDETIELFNDNTCKFGSGTLYTKGTYEIKDNFIEFSFSGMVVGYKFYDDKIVFNERQIYKKID